MLTPILWPPSRWVVLLAEEVLDLRPAGPYTPMRFPGQTPPRVKAPFVGYLTKGALFLQIVHLGTSLIVLYGSAGLKSSTVSPKFTALSDVRATKWTADLGGGALSALPYIVGTANTFC